MPSGLFFALIGLVLCALGLLAPGLGAPLTSENVNLYWGLVLLLVGGVLLWLARRRS